MAFTKEEKTKMLAQYEEWLKRSEAVYVLEYKKMTQKDLDTLRGRVRETGGEFHMVKNTLMSLALERQGLENPNVFEGASIVGFAFSDPPALAKVFSEATAKSEVFKLKGGYLGKQIIDNSAIKSLAELPPLPVMRARLMGVIQAPAAQLVRTIAEPARGLASVFRAYSEKDSVPTEAAA